MNDITNRIAQRIQSGHVVTEASVLVTLEEWQALDKHIRSLEDEIATADAELQRLREQEPAIWLGTKLVPYEERVFRGGTGRDLAEKLGYSNDLRGYYAEPKPVPSVPAVPEWQPIETAPKDGSSVILRSRGVPQKIADGYWLQGSYNGAGAWIWPYVHANPSEWMPLPATPSPTEKKEG